MAKRVGIDLVSVGAVRDSIRDHGDRYLKRIYTERELDDCHSEDGIVAERLAARFAAKEALLKVLRPVDEPIPWRSMGVVRHGPGWVTLELSGRAAELAAEAGLHDFELSICHEADYASAVVIAELDLRNGGSGPMMST
ncbi:MAG TPA: holo-ACP synthase [Solirubrobacteraceae bacterium]|nr:holo-ACP synthase [Solirubrobacteraceae bacterium]